MVKISANKNGYYTLEVNDEFVGNYDTVTEAVNELENLYEECGIY